MWVGGKKWRKWSNERFLRYLLIGTGEEWNKCGCPEESRESGHSKCQCPHKYHLSLQTLTHIREVQMPLRLGVSLGSKKHSLAFSASIRGRCTTRIGNGGIREERREVVIHPPPNTQHLPKIMTTSPSLDMEPGDIRRQSHQVASREEDFCEFKFSLS